MEQEAGQEASEAGQEAAGAAEAAAVAAPEAGGEVGGEVAGEVGGEVGGDAAEALACLEVADRLEMEIAGDGDGDRPELEAVPLAPAQGLYLAAELLPVLVISAASPAVDARAAAERPRRAWALRDALARG